MVHHDCSTRGSITVLQQNGASGRFKKMGHHSIVTRWRTTVFQQDWATWLLNKMEHHCRSTKWSTTAVQQDGAPPHFHTGPMLFSHSATQKENWTYGNYWVAPPLPRPSGLCGSSTICNSSSRWWKGRTALCCSQYCGIGVPLEHLQSSKGSWHWKTSGLVSLEFLYWHNISLESSSWLSSTLYLPS